MRKSIPMRIGKAMGMTGAVKHRKMFGNAKALYKTSRAYMHICTKTKGMGELCYFYVEFRIFFVGVELRFAI